MSLFTLQPTSLQLQQATHFANIYAENGFGKNVLKVSHDEYIHFIRIGKLCELVLIHYLQKQHIAIEADELLIPHAGKHKIGADFTLLHSQQGVDVKAANKSFHKRILIREDQFQAHIHDLYIGAKYIHDHQIDYYGYMTGHIMKQIVPQDFGHGMCRSMMLDDLKPISQLIDCCKKGMIVS
ncbi:MAG TPA: hypothetical protein PKC41_03290 [Chitinophagaceae bacterium]|jgi:hypothetical protein|nr:hypothetical protein [Chitinophagaceae bacterium]